MLQNPETALGSVERDGLAQRALEVLEANWRGASTVPSPALYPHQWTRYSACIAIGYSHLGSGARRAGSSVPCSRASGATGCSPTSSSPTGRTTSPARSSGRQSPRSMLPRPADVRHRPAPCARHFGAPRSTETTRSGVIARKFLEELLPKLEAVARLPVPGTKPSRRRVDRDLAPVGVGHGQLAALGPGARRAST